MNTCPLPSLGLSIMLRDEPSLLPYSVSESASGVEVRSSSHFPAEETLSTAVPAEDKSDSKQFVQSFISEKGDSLGVKKFLCEVIS